MKVKQLIAKLKKMPPNAEVYTAAQDNSEWETAGNSTTVTHYVKKDLREAAERACDDKWELEAFESLPKEWVTISS